jgi:ER membrane protein complex subunit 8/9
MQQISARLFQPLKCVCVSAMELSFNFDDIAILKILLHSSRHTSSAISGLCLGERSGDSVRVTDAVPLFHTQSIHGPLLPTALIQVTLSD